MSKLTKAQRATLLPPDLRNQILNLSDDVLLAAHDLMHDVMEARYGSNKRAEALSPVERERLELRYLAKSVKPIWHMVPPGKDAQLDAWAGKGWARWDDGKGWSITPAGRSADVAWDGQGGGEW